MAGNTPPNPNQHNNPQDQFDQDLINAQFAERVHDQDAMDQARSDMRQAALNDPDYFKAARSSYEQSVEQGDPGDANIEAALRPPTPELGKRTNEKIYTDQEMEDLQKEMRKTDEGIAFEQALSKLRTLGANADPAMVAGLTKRLDLFVTGTKNDSEYGKDAKGNEGPKFNKNFQLDGDPRRAAIIVYELRKARERADNWQPSAGIDPKKDRLAIRHRELAAKMDAFSERFPHEEEATWRREQRLKQNNQHHAIQRKLQANRDAQARGDLLPHPDLDTSQRRVIANETARNNGQELPYPDLDEKMQRNAAARRAGEDLPHPDVTFLGAPVPYPNEEPLNRRERMRQRAERGGLVPEDSIDAKRFIPKREVLADGTYHNFGPQYLLTTTNRQKWMHRAGFSDAARERRVAEQEDYDKTREEFEDLTRRLAVRQAISNMAGDMPTIKREQIQGMEQVIGSMEYFQQNPTPEAEAAKVDAHRDKIDAVLRHIRSSNDLTDLDAEHTAFCLLQEATAMTNELNDRINKLDANDPMRGELRMVADRMMTTQLTRVGHYAQLRMMRHDIAGRKPDEPARDGAPLPSYTRDGGVELKDGSGVVIYADSYAVMQPDGTPGRRMFITDPTKNDWDPNIAHDASQVDPHRPNHLDITPSQDHKFRVLLDDIDSGAMTPRDLNQLYNKSLNVWLSDLKYNSTNDFWNVSAAYSTWLEKELADAQSSPNNKGYSPANMDELQTTANQVRFFVNWSSHVPGEWNQKTDLYASVNFPDGTVIEAEHEYYGLRGAWCIHPNGVRELVQPTSTGPTGKPRAYRRFDPTGREIPVI